MDLAELFFNTVHIVNSKDYTEEQLNAWASGDVDLDAWNKSFLEHYSIVAFHEDIIIGFGDIDNTGYLDRLYVHVDFQRKGIARVIEYENKFTVKYETGEGCDTLKKWGKVDIYLSQELVSDRGWMCFGAQ